MKDKGNFSGLLPFSFLIMLTMIAVLIIFITALSIISYSETRTSMEDAWKDSIHTSEQHLIDSLHLVSQGLRLFELTYDSDLKSAFVPFLHAYNETEEDPGRLNLEQIKQNLPSEQIKKTDLYIIDRNGVVINATYKPDIGLDFTQWPDVYKQITKIRLGNTFQSDRAVIGFRNDQIIRKFAYFPTPDHQYLLELSYLIDDYPEERLKFSYAAIIKNITTNNPRITSITLYDAMFRSIAEGGSVERYPDNETTVQVKNVFQNRKDMSITDTNGQISERYLFISMGSHDTVSDSLLDMVAHVRYDSSKYSTDLQSNFLYHTLIALISVILSVFLAYLLTRHLTRPIQCIIDDIDKIAKGDLDHPVHHSGSHEFARLEGSISTLVSSLKALIDALQEKEKKIISSEQQYRLLIENQTDVIVLFDTSAVVLYVNEAFCRFFHLSKEGVIGSSLYDITSGNLLEKIQQYMTDMSKEPETAIIETPILLNTGQQKWVQWSSSFICNELGEVMEYQAVGRDVTTRKEIEIALMESEEKYRTLISQLPDYVIVHRDGIVLYVNDATSHVLGYTNEELIGSHVLDFVSDEDKDTIIRFMQQRIAGKEIPEYEIRIKKKDNTYRTVTVRASLISFGGKRTFLTVLTDLSDRKSAEDQVLKSELKYRRLIEQLNEGIWITDKNGMTIFVNTRMQDILHYSGIEIVGKPYASFVSPDQIPFLLEKFECRRKGLAERYPLTFVTRDGKKVYTEVSATPSLDSEGNISGSFAVVTDVTRRKETEMQLEKYTQDLETKTKELETARDQLCEINEDLDRIIRERTDQVMNLLRQKDEFIMQLGHDLRTPLTPILGLLPDLIHEEKDVLNRQALRIIRQNVKFIQDIADKSLKLARMNSFDINPEIEPVEIRSEISGMVSTHATELVHAGITIHNIVPADLKIAADKILFHELIENLISNGIKYINRPDGFIIFHATLEGDMIQITVQDNGNGLRIDETEKIFDVFYKSDDSRHDKSSTGLGLSICKRIVENHGGTIRAESPGPGQGTSFIIMLPAWKKGRE